MEDQSTMEIIEKTTKDGDIQYFEILKSRKELSEWLHDNLFEAYQSGIFNDEDSSIVYYTKDSSCHIIEFGDKIKHLNAANIAKFVHYGPNSTTIYGNIPIIQNAHYGDWEVDI
jgi:hypothetical protein